MTSHLPRLACLGLAVLLPGPALAACETASPPRALALLELYTSEGCSSCPPADRWLSALRDAPAVAGRVVPLALHVDYWDYIGWKDAYAQPAFALRQRRLAQAGGVGVYTPQFFLQGRPYRPPATAAAFAADLEAVARRPPGADLSLSLGPAAEGRLTVQVTAQLTAPRRPARDGLGLYVVLYENGLSSEVATGENRGATLRHDFVVRAWSGPRPLPPGGGRETVMFSLAPGWQAGRLGVATFIQDLDSQEILQAVARPACG